MSQSDNRAVSERTAAEAAPEAPVPTKPSVVEATPPTPVPPSVPPRTAEEIERDIETTRARLASSIDELTDRVSPKNVARRSVDKARLTVVDETGAPRITRLATVGAVVAALIGIMLWRRRG